MQVGISASIQNHTDEEMQYTCTKSCIPIEEHAQSILTPFAFSALQHELILAMQYATSEMANGSHLVSHFRKMDGERLVIWIPETEQLHCSCKEFESSGILCRHALRVLIMKNYFQMPEKYFPSRWRRARAIVSSYDGQSSQNADDEWFQEYNSLTATLFKESSVTKERTDYVRREISKELSKLLDEVRNMPANEGVATDMALSPTG